MSPEARPDPDADLIDALRAGDGSAWATLLDRYERKVHGLCVRMVGHRATAEDLAQEAFLRAWKSVGRFDGRAAFGTWLYRITMNLCLTELRARGRRSVRESEAATEQGRAAQGAGEPDGPTSVETREEAVGAARALASLSDEHRAILVLRDVRGLEYSAIAEALEIAPGTVKSRLFRARAALREVLEHQEGSGHDSSA